MAVVSTNKIKLQNRDDFIRKVSCDKYGKFSCAFPAIVAQYNDCGHAHGDTLDECLVNWNKTVDDFFKGKQKQKKVILYKYSREPDEYGFSSAPPLFFEFHAYACVETEITDAAGNKRYMYDEPDYEMHSEEDRWERAIPDAIRNRSIKPSRTEQEFFKNQIPYTPEAVKFFVEMEAMMEKLKDRLDEILKTPKSLITFASRGVALLEPPKRNQSKGDQS